jgi:hypothetical protein
MNDDGSGGGGNGINECSGPSSTSDYLCFVRITVQASEMK